MSNLSLSQTTSTSPIKKCFDAATMDQVYKGLKQGEYLKERLDKTEISLKEADLLIREQKASLLNKDNTITVKDNLIANNKFQCEKDVEILNIEIKRLNETFAIERQLVKKEKRKALWTGVKIGGVSVTVLGVAALFLLK